MEGKERGNERKREEREGKGRRGKKFRVAKSDK